MKSNEFWTSPWQQLRLINHYSVQIYMHPDFMNPRINLHTVILVRRSLTTGEGICLTFVCWLFRPPCLLSVMGSALCPGSFWPRLAAPAWHGPPAEPCTRWGQGKERTRKRESHLERICCQLPFIFSSDTEKIQRTKTARIFQTPDTSPPKLPKLERRKTCPQPQNYLKKNKQEKQTNSELGWLVKIFHSSGG